MVVNYWLVKVWGDGNEIVGDSYVEPSGDDDAINTFSSERIYPPSRSLTSASHSLSDQRYGNGLYKTWGLSRQYDSEPYNAFNDHLNKNFYGYSNQYQNGEFIGDSYISSYYKGDGIIIKLPYKIELTSYGFKQRFPYSYRAPAQYRIYGSNDNTIWDVLVDKTSNIQYENGRYYENVKTSNEYQFFALVVSKLNGNGKVLNFNQWYIYGKERILSQPPSPPQSTQEGEGDNEECEDINCNDCDHDDDYYYYYQDCCEKIC